MDQINDKITFARYYNSLTTVEKRNFRNEVAPYVSVSHLYSQLRGENKIKPLLRKEIERVANQQFNWE